MSYKKHSFSSLSVVLLLSLLVLQANAQTQHETTIKKIYDEALLRGQSYPMLTYLTTKIGARLSGSPQAAAAVEWSRHIMQHYGFDSVWLQPVLVPHWVRGEKEVAIIQSKIRSNVPVNVLALGGSIGTGTAGVQAQIVEVKDFEELKTLGEKNVKGKIVFFNRPMDATKIQTFAAYGGAVNQRGAGPSEAAKYGAVAAIVRSMGSNSEEYAHTGGLRYAPNVGKIPAVAISTKHADLLSEILRAEKEVTVYIRTTCETLPDAPSFNVIGEIKGKEFPKEYIVVSGHLDSWDVGQGAHDDGAGCVQAIEALRLLKQIGYQPRYTIRAVMYMNEENGLRGGIEYAKQADVKKEKHLAAMESDRGGFTPRGFTMSVPDKTKTLVQSWKPMLEPYGLTDFSQEGGGADIGPLGPLGVPLFGYLPDSQRYFDYHHTQEDTIDKVNKRELELGAAAMAALTYLIDSSGLK
ncbi:MAG: M20/M25/M40 family metallo-hydrolase [Flammeovirgaceae bacterium]|nr:M20/M25/M40 family metallo-hydrolase [Flammeovirgaceae bacterium]